MSKHIYPPDPGSKDYTDLYGLYIDACKKISSYNMDVDPKGMYLLDAKEMAHSLIHNIDPAYRHDVTPIGCSISKNNARYYYIRLIDSKLVSIIEIVLPYKDKPYVTIVKEDELSQHGALIDVYNKYMSSGYMFVRLFYQRKERPMKDNSSHNTRNHGVKH